MKKNKDLFRKKYISLRNTLSSEDIDQKSIAISNQLLTMDIWDKEFYHTYLSIPKNKEVDTEFILHILYGKDKNVVVSKSDFQNHTLTHYLLTETTKLTVNNWGIPEPETGIPIPENMIDVVFVPLLAFDENGNRLGYGKGFYDRFLSACKPNCLKIGLSFFEAEELIPATHLDQKLTHCVTPEKIYTF